MTAAPPQNIELEQALLGAVLMNNDAYWRVNGLVGAEDFYEGVHARIFAAIGERIEAGGRADPVVLRNRFGEEEIAAGLTGAAYLARLAANATTVINAPDYAKEIADLAARRRLVDAAERIHADALDCDIAIADVLKSAEDALYLGSERAATVKPQDISSVAAEVVSDAATAYQEQGRRAGLATGLADLDQLLGPMLPGDLVVLAGATAAGKTAIAQQIAENVARASYRTVYVTLEMTAKNLVARHVAQQSQVASWRIESGRFNESEYIRIAEAATQAFQDIPLRIIDTSRTTFSRIRSAVLRENKLHGLDFLVIDHLRFISFEDPRQGLAEGTSQITAGCKALAKDLGIPVLLLAQFNRELQKREQKRPQMSDLYGGAAIEQDADTVFFVHRDEYWLERSEPPEGTPEWNEWDVAMRRARGKADCILAKRRRGRGAGQCVLSFEGGLTKFSDYRPDRAEGQGALV